MTTKTNLNITLLEQYQNNYYATANEAIDRLALSVSHKYSVDLAGLTGDQTLNSVSCLGCAVIMTSGAMAGACEIIVPKYEKIYWVVHNGTSDTLTIKTTSSTSTVTIDSGNAQIVFCDGVNMWAISATGAGGGGIVPAAKTRTLLTGTGGTNVLAIGANVSPSSVEVFINKQRGIVGVAPYDYTITESSPGSGNYDQLTPSFSGAFPSGAPVEVLYYVA